MERAPAQKQQQPATGSSNAGEGVDFATFSLWHLVSDFLTLSEVLTAREVCRQWNQGLCNGVSLQQSLRYLERALQQRNLTVLHDTVQQPWAHVLQHTSRQERIQSILSSNSSSNSSSNNATNNSPFQIMLKTFRILRHMPAQMAICYNEKYGRHGLPMQWSTDTQQSEPIVYGNCQRNDDTCPTCQARPSTLTSEHDELDGKKPAKSNDTSLAFPDHNEERSVSEDGDESEEDLDYDIHNAIEILEPVAEKKDSDSNRRSLNLSQFTNQCIPNLPSDLVCPVCQLQDRRTLLLTGFSYASTSTGPDELSPLGYRTCNLLTLTPTATEGVSMPEGNSPRETSTISEEMKFSNGNRNTVKRPRLSFTNAMDECYLFPPPSYQDLAIPVADGSSPSPQPLRPKSHVKHVTSIHCVECRQFAVLAPAGICWSSRFPCLTRSQKLNNNNNDQDDSTAAITHMGGMLVRTSCSEPNCARPVFCHNCSHASWHMPYPFENNNNANGIDPTIRVEEEDGHPPPLRNCMQMQHSSRCDFCKLDYCPAHAWLSTVCHHW